MLKKRFTTVILALAVAVAIPCTAFAGELDTNAAVATPTTSIGETASNSTATAETVNVSNIANNAVNENNDRAITAAENDNNDTIDTVGENTAADNNDVQDLTLGSPTDSENQLTTTEPNAEEQQAVEAPDSTLSEQIDPVDSTEQAGTESTVEQEVITEETAADEAIVVDIVEEPVPLEEKPTIVEEALPLEEVPTIIEELPTIVEEIPTESTLVIHHLFQYGDIVCDDYVTITDLTAGDSIRIGEYNYEDEYIFVECLNSDEMITLAEGENEVVLNYTLKDGFRMAE